MRWLGRFLMVALLVAVGGAVWGYQHEKPMLRTGTGYAAHSACGLTYVAGRDDPKADLPPNALLPYLTGYDNKAGRSSAAAVLWVLAKQHAFYTRGYGCTVADERPTGFGRASEVASDPNPFTDARAPEMTPEVTEALARAFGDDLTASGKEALGTRAVVVLRGGELVGERSPPRAPPPRRRSSAGRWPRAPRACSSAGTRASAGSTSARTTCDPSGPTTVRPSLSTS
jgi:hypothetical protein